MADQSDIFMTNVSLTTSFEASGKIVGDLVPHEGGVSSRADPMGGLGSPAVGVSQTLVDPMPDISTSGRARFSAFELIQA